ncbi:MAG TPA: hypothetical protein DHW40_07165 [Microbacterium sp.]|nr:hypothetical protein [Microbacterium sp.]
MATISSRVSMLRALALTMPSSRRDDEGHRSLDRLMDAGTWLHTEALHSSMVSFGPPYDHDIDMSDTTQVVDALLNGSVCNLDPRLLSGVKHVQGNVAPLSDPKSPWHDVYNERESLLTDRMSGARHSSLAEAAGATLLFSIGDYEDALVSVLDRWGRQA